MGYAYYVLPDGRMAGYGVSADCDGRCGRRIDRGLGYLCGSEPDGHRDPEEPGCGRYFCGECQHDCPNPECGEWSEDGNLCCELVAGHDGVHRDGDGATFTETEDGAK